MAKIGVEMQALVGRWAAVHPRLTTGPVNRQGQTGKILTVDENKITVIFDDDKTGAYSPDGILLLLPMETILKDLVATNDLITHQNCKLILQVCKLASKEKCIEALRLAVANNITQTLCTVNCETWMRRRSMNEKKCLKGSVDTSKFRLNRNKLIDSLREKLSGINDTARKRRQ